MDFSKILDEAHAAAQEAQKQELAKAPETQRDPCGFAWVKVSGRDPLAVWCRAEHKRRVKAMKINADMVTREVAIRIRELEIKLGSKGDPGWQWWKPGRFAGQAIRVHEIGAFAFRKKLAEYGISATVGSRLD